MATRRGIGLFGVVLILLAATAVVVSVSAGAHVSEGSGAVINQENQSENQERSDSDLTIEHDPFESLQRGTTVDSGQKFTTETLVITPGHVDDRPSQDKTMQFGSGVGRSLEIRHPESGSTVTVRPKAGEGSYEVENVKLDIYNGRGEIDENPSVEVDSTDGDAKIAVEVSGDTDMFTGLDATFTSFEVALLEDREVVDTTDERTVGVAYEGSLEQDSTTGEITVTLNRDEEVDPNWHVEFGLRGSEFSTVLDHSSGDDVFEATFDASQLEPGNYSGYMWISREGGPTARGLPLVVLNEYNGITVGGDETRQTDEGTVTGTVTDERGAPLEGVNVRLFDSEDSFVTNTTTDASGTYSIEVDPGTYNLLFEAEGYAVDGTEGIEIETDEQTTSDFTLTPAEAAALDVTVDGTSSPVSAGETLAVDMTVENVGGESTTETVELRDEEGTVLDQVSLTLGPGQAQSATLEWETGGADDGSHTLVVAGGNTTTETTVNVGLETDGFVVAVESTNAPVTEGDRLDVRAAIENVADESDTQTVELRREDGTVLDEQTLSLDAGDSRTLQFEWDTTGDDVGEHTLSVASADDADETTVTVDEFSLGVLIQPSAPTTFQTVTFTRVTIGEAEERTLVWDFGDGSQATGNTVSNRYLTAGTYEVTVTDEDSGATDTFDVDVSMPTVDADATEPVGKSVRGVDREYGGTPIEGVSWEESFTVDLQLESLWDIESVEYELDGQTETVDSADESVTFDLGEIDGPSVLTVTAIDEDGTEDQHTETIRTTEIPSTLEQFYDEAAITVDEAAGTINATAPVFDLSQHLPFENIPFPGASAKFLGLTEATISYDADTPAATLDGGAKIDGWQPFLDLNGELDIDGQLDSGLNLLEAQATGEAAIEGIPGPGLSPDLPDSVPEVLNLSVGTNFDVRFAAQGDFDDQLVLQQGVIQPGATINVEATLDAAGCGVKVGGSGGIDASYGVSPPVAFGGSPRDAADTGNLGGQITLTATAQIYCLVYEIGPDYEWTIDYGSGPEIEPLATLAKQPGPQWEVQSKRGANPSALSGEFERLTDRPLQDTQPAVAGTDDGLVVAWSSQDESKPVTAGRDLHLGTYDQRSGEWSETGSITDDRTLDERPELASTEDATLAVWSTLDERIDASADGPGELFAHQEIAYAIGDASGFSEPVVLTDTPDRQSSPAVTAVEDGWVLAWQSGGTTDGETDVKYVHVAGDGTVGSIETISNAGTPALGPDGDGASLAYASTSEVVTASIDGDGTAVEQHRYETSGTDDVVTTGGRTLWVEGNQTSPRLLEGSGDGMTELDLRSEVRSVSKLNLATHEGKTVLGYRARTADSPSRDFVYRLDRGDGWIQDRSFASPSANLSAWSGDVAFAADGESFHSAFAGRPVADEPVDDIFVTDHEFKPAYTISATATEAAVGEDSTVSFEVENVGDIRSGDGVSVVVETDETSEREPVSTIDAGEAVEGSLDVPVDESGTFTVTVEHDDETLDTGRETTTATAVRPRLSLEEVTSEQGANGELTVTASVRNDGGVVASDVPIVFDDGDQTQAVAEIDRIEAGNNATAEVSLAPETVNGTVADQVRIDTDAVPPAHIADGQALAWFRQPDVTVSSVNYVEDGGLRAEVLVSNRGSGPATGTLTIVDRQSETVLGQADLELNGAVDGQEPFETVEIPLDSASAGDEIHLYADTTVPDADSSTTGLTDTIGPVLAGDRPLFAVTITNVDTPVRAGETLTLEAEILNLGSEADSQRIVLDADGREVLEETVELAPRDRTTVTLDYQTDGDGASTVDLLVRSATAYDRVTAGIDTGGEDGTGGDGETDGDSTDGESGDSGDETGDGDDGTDGDDDGPGFGILVAITAMLVVGYLQHRSRRPE